MGFIINIKCLRCGRHLANGSPVNPGGQAHMGLWNLVVHTALNPHVFGHGSTHF